MFQRRSSATSSTRSLSDTTNIESSTARKGKMKSHKINSTPTEFSSQTEGGFNSESDSDSVGDSSEDELNKKFDNFVEIGSGAMKIRRFSSSASSSNGITVAELSSGSTGGRGEFVLVERKSSGMNGIGMSGSGSSSPSFGFASLSTRLSLPAEETRKRLSWDGLRVAGWGRGNDENVDRESSSKKSAGASKTVRGTSKRRSKMNSKRKNSFKERDGVKNVTVQVNNEEVNRLSIDTIRYGFNPLSIAHFRWNLLPEVLLLYSGLLLGIYRLHSMSSTSSYSIISNFSLIISIFSLLIPFITLFRSPNSYSKLPFTDYRAYRNVILADDGLVTAICVPLLLSLACLWDVYETGIIEGKEIGLESIKPLTQVWIESGLKPVYKDSISQEFITNQMGIAIVVFQARYELMLITFLNTVILVIHLALAKTVFKIEALSKSNSKRFFSYMGLSSFISMTVFCILSLYDSQYDSFISPLEFGIASFIQQASFYIISRLARNGFTLGELSIMTTVGTTLCLEFWRLTRARWLFKRGFPSIPPSFRSPTPIVVFQSVLIPGAFLSGFLLSPLLVISRHIAGKPSHRLKWPTERDRHRKLIALAVFTSLFGIVFFLLGGWSSWMLIGGITRPWSWAVNFIVYPTGNSEKETWWNRWKRLILVTYWGGTITFAIAGWTTRFVRARRIRMKKSAGGEVSGKVSGVEGEECRGVAMEGMREEKKVHASLNMRRKFFHALAVIMFIPGIAIDSSFTSLAFSLAFAIFTFSEYARYFALYPIGAPLHIFFSEFVDGKDSGPVILSHFYLLTGCAGGLWLEGNGIKRFTGVLVLGVADALASIVGKLIGRYKWPGTSKTVEGTFAFVVSLILCAWTLRFFHLVDDFSIPKYALVSTLAGLLEAVSNQNDNMIIPVYMWSLLSLWNV